MARSSREFQLWLSIEVKDAESMTKKEWNDWLADQKSALQKHFAKALHVQKVKINMGHLELK